MTQFKTTAIKFQDTPYIIEQFFSMKLNQQASESLISIMQ